MRWAVRVRFKAEIESLVLEDAPTLEEVEAIIKDHAAKDELENFEIIEIQPYIDMTDDGTPRIVN